MAGAKWRYSDDRQPPPLSMNLAVRKHLTAGDSPAEEIANATQLQGPYLPVAREKPTVELVKVTDELKSFKAYDKLHVERMNKRHVGARLKKAAEAEKEEEK